MHTLKIFWEMGNLTFSAMCVVVFVLLYSNITLGKASRTARTALFSFSLLIHIAFFAVSYIMYGNVAVLMLNDLRILFNIFSWGSYLLSRRLSKPSGFQTVVPFPNQLRFHVVL